MKRFRFHFNFNKQERSGIFFLLLVIVSLQVAYFLLNSYPETRKSKDLLIDFETQTKIDALKNASLQKDSFKIYPFNPNYITDYKGYTLGMSVDEIDRLHAFRAQNNFVNSPEDFQEVTRVSDSLLKVLAPYFKFPDWVRTSKQSSVDGKKYSVGADPKERTGNLPPSGRLVENFSDLNSATAQDLKQIYGIGDKLSERIIKFRDRLGGFLVDEQLSDVYGLEPDVVQRALKKFKVISRPKIVKIDLNKASAAEISQLVYIKFRVAEEIVVYRENHGSIASFDELRNIVDFPLDKIDRIKLYLTL